MKTELESLHKKENQMYEFYSEVLKNLRDDEIKKKNKIHTLSRACSYKNGNENYIYAWGAYEKITLYFTLYRFYTGWCC